MNYVGGYLAILTISRCSRELPKCDTCKPWPGDCRYSRDRASASKRKKRPRSPSPAASDLTLAREISLESFGRRLLALEETIKSLSDLVKQGQGEKSKCYVNDHAAIRLTRQDRISSAPKARSTLDDRVDPSSSEIPKLSGGVTIQSSDMEARKVAYAELRQLKTAAKPLSQDRPGVEQEVSFYVPSKKLGYSLISRFFEDVESGEVFFRSPSDEIVQQVIFQPQHVREKAWIVSVNYMLLSTYTMEPEKEDLVGSLRQNTRLALNNSSIFLEPSAANIQALALLALHGEDYAAPSLSWMLLGHACRQAEALGLHRSNSGDATSQQNLSLFWLLFIADKSCALSFGRPAFLPTTAYGHVSVPDFTYLSNFRPHQTRENDENSRPESISTFGAHLFSSSIELAKLTGTILDLLATNSSAEVKNSMHSKLYHWHQSTHQILTHDINAEGPSINETQRQEMTLGINGLKFQYLNILILLFQGDDAHSSVRLESSREALTLLPSMVSNWSSVYNGVVWHLLYYPFTAFFVIFEAILSHQTASTPSVKHDMELLSTTVKYFESMQSHVHALSKVVTRLHHIASTFLRLAQNHLNREDQRAITEKKGSNQTSKGTATIPVGPLNSASVVPRHLDDLELEAPDFDMFLEWLPSDLDSLWSTLDAGQPSSTVSKFDANRSTHAIASSDRPGVDGTFDWFAWDAYYRSAL